MPRQIASFNSTKLNPYVDPENAKTQAAQFAPNQTLARGTVVAQITSAGATQGMFVPYNSANADGSQVPLGILVWDIVVDANGYATLGGAGSTPDLIRSPDLTSEYYWRGCFLISELTGFDANAFSVLRGKYYGFGATKYVYIP